MGWKYDVFVSHSSLNAELAKKIVDELEHNGMKCFIAPRNMTGGRDYATELVENIDDCPIFLFLFTNESNRSGMVIREINEAVNANRYIITLKIDDVQPNKSIKFYLSVTHWLDIGTPIDITDINTILSAIRKALGEQEEKEKPIIYSGYHVLGTDELLKIGYTEKQINIACINIDYEYLDSKNLDIYADTAEQEWLDNYEKFPELLDCLVFDDKIEGYYTFAFVNDENAEKLAAGEILDTSMFEYYEFGGELHVYVTFFPISKGHNSGQNYKKLIMAFFERIEKLSKENDVAVQSIIIASYADSVDRAMTALGLKAANDNSASGALFTISRGDAQNPRLKKFFPGIEEIFKD